VSGSRWLAFCSGGVGRCDWCVKLISEPSRSESGQGIWFGRSVGLALLCWFGRSCNSCPHPDRLAGDQPRHFQSLRCKHNSSWRRSDVLRRTKIWFGGTMQIGGEHGSDVCASGSV
jgi:hypothetical protein